MHEIFAYNFLIIGIIEALINLMHLKQSTLAILNQRIRKIGDSIVIAS